jgi:N-acylneuraminate cytidylyltransferase
MMQKRECLAVIPARGGSKGIPRKNLRIVAGVPLVGHAIRAALGSRHVSRVVVSTDDPDIAAVAKKEGAGVVLRPAAISGDTASSEAALLHVLEQLKAVEGYEPDLLVFMQCTSPLTTSGDVDAAVDALSRRNADTALTVSSFHGFLWSETAEGEAVGLNHDKTRRPLRQELKPEYLENGAVYVIRVAPFLEKKHRFFGKTVISVMPPERSMDIDEPADLERAEEILSRGTGVGGLEKRLAETPVRALVMDFDGVMTDNRVTVDAAGVESVTCSRGDGLGLGRLKAFPIAIAVISTERNPVVSARCAKLGIECIQGVDRKDAVLERWCSDHGISPSEVLYVGNDVNDAQCLALAGVSVVPQDAHPHVLGGRTIRLRNLGGHGAVREVCDALIGCFAAKERQGA